jgi:hypothetical protein
MAAKVTTFGLIVNEVSVSISNLFLSRTRGHMYTCSYVPVTSIRVCVKECACVRACVRMCVCVCMYVHVRVCVCV